MLGSDELRASTSVLTLSGEGSFIRSAYGAATRFHQAVSDHLPIGQGVRPVQAKAEEIPNEQVTQVTREEEDALRPRSRTHHLRRGVRLRGHAERRHQPAERR